MVDCVYVHRNYEGGIRVESPLQESDARREIKGFWLKVRSIIINNETLVQEGVAEGSGKLTDIGIGGFGLGGAGGVLGGAGGRAWNNTAEGKVVAAVLMDAANKMVPLLRDLNVPQVPVASGTVKRNNSRNKYMANR